MQEITVTIKWDRPDEPYWLNADNIKTALSSYCKNTSFEVEASRDSRHLSAVPSDFTHRIFIIMSGDKELERIASADVAIDLLLLHQNGEYPNARIFKMKIK